MPVWSSLVPVKKIFKSKLYQINLLSHHNGRTILVVMGYIEVTYLILRKFF